jgi:hypothetical protein
MTSLSSGLKSTQKADVKLGHFGEYCRILIVAPPTVYFILNFFDISNNTYCLFSSYMLECCGET